MATANQRAATKTPAKRSKKQTGDDQQRVTARLTGRRVVRTLRRQQHKVAILEHLHMHLLSSLTDAYDTPRLAVAVGGVVERADDATVEALSIEFANRAQKAKLELTEMLGGDVSKLELVEDDGDEPEEKLGELRCEVVDNPEVQPKAGR
jgi:hypothetical protein